MGHDSDSCRALTNVVLDYHTVRVCLDLKAIFSSVPPGCGDVTAYAKRGSADTQAIIVNSHCEGKKNQPTLSFSLHTGAHCF